MPNDNVFLQFKLRSDPFYLALPDPGMGMDNQLRLNAGVIAPARI